MSVEQLLCDASSHAMAVAITKEVVSVTLPDALLGVSHAGNWPTSAEYGVDYWLRDKQFPQVDHGLTTVYFDDNAALQAWIAEKREWVRGTDYDFSMTYRVYAWDWGPSFRYDASM